MATKCWCDVPNEVLSRIASLLDLADLVRFRAVCKDFLRAASTGTSTAEVGSQVPWFLVYGESRCSMLSCHGTHANSFSIKELEGATVLASVEGWLLVFKQGSMFFLCPFSRARIDLPNFPRSEPSIAAAAVSCPPTSPICVVAILTRSSHEFPELHVIDRLCSDWTRAPFYCYEPWVDTIKTAAYINDNFYFLGNKTDEGLICCVVYGPFSDRGIYAGRLLAVPNLIPEDRQLPENSVSPFVILKGLIEKENPYHLYGGVLTWSLRLLGEVKQLLGVNNDVSMSSCGELVNQTILMSEKIQATPQIQGVQEVWIRRVKGVWVRPRFHEKSANRRWLIDSIMYTN